jgi:hypothetical protein
VMLEQRIIEKGLEVGPLQSYIDSFKHGVSPHAGAGIGLDRVVFLYLGKHARSSILLCILYGMRFFCANCGIHCPPCLRALDLTDSVICVLLSRPGQRAQGLHVPQRPQQVYAVECTVCCSRGCK